MKFEIYKDNAGEYRVRLWADNGNIICSTEGYSSKDGAKNAIRIMVDTDENTEIEDNS